ncbi:MAG: TonB-dependent receptor [Candidatus Eremiobacteraeota bacterium]|nr:TonB-dependent receptor [Candidatus Eremiobacteraeota bacterium]
MRYLIAAIFAAGIVSIAAPVLADTTGFVRGTVTSAAKPVAGAAVTLRGEGTTLSATSAANGVFSFARVPFGRYSITVHHAGLPDFSEPITVDSGSVVDLPIELGLRTIGRTATGLVKGAAANPVSVNSVGAAQFSVLPQNQSLNRVIETFPGVVSFSYNEPVVHGFHGLTYELDGVPLPQGTTSNFSEIVDPRTIDSLELFTGAFPAEFGGSRQGAVVNILSHRQNLSAPEEGSFTFGAGSYGDLQTSLAESLTLGRTRLFFNANMERTDRGIDPPTFVPIHDHSNTSDQFVRTISNIGKNDTVSFDASNDDAAFQIPIDPNPGDPNDPVIVPASTDDVQHEYSIFFNAVYTHNAASGNSYTQVAPWYRYDRVRYLGDIPSDLAGGIDGLTQDRHSNFEGLRLTQFNVFGNNAVKAGIDESVENFAGNESIAYFTMNAGGMPVGPVQTFTDDAAQRGSQFGAYIEDKWTPTRFVSVDGGLRVDHSTGYVSGSRLSPRIEVNGQIDPHDILHGYFGRLYAAPFLEDTRKAAVLLGGDNASGALPSYDLQPENDSYYEFGLAHTFALGARATINFWKRDVTDVLDTTQLANTPIFAVFNNTIGIAKGVEGRVDASWNSGDSLFFSTQLSSSKAGGISGSTFLFPPDTNPRDVTLSPEDHDQTFSADLGYTKHFGAGRAFFATVEPQYGTGFPVQFQNGTGRLPPHLTFGASFGRGATRTSKPALGFTADFQNFTNTRYLLKINNGFNTTQWGEGFRADLRVTAPF